MTPEGEFRAGLEAAVADAFWDALDYAVCLGDDRPHAVNPMWGDRPDPPEDFDRWCEFMASRVLDAALAFRLPDQPEGPRVAVVGEQVGWWDKYVDDTETGPVFYEWFIALPDEDDTEYGSMDRVSRSPVFTLGPATPETP